MPLEAAISNLRRAEETMRASASVTQDPGGSRDFACYSAVVVKPFIKLLTAGDACAWLEREVFGIRNSDDRVSVARVHTWVARAVAQTKDPSLGLRAAAITTFGEMGVLDYLMNSAATVNEALGAATPHFRIVSDEIEARVIFDNERTLFRLDSRSSLPAAIEDLLLGTLYRAHDWLREIPDLEVRFAHPSPLDSRPYRDAFGGTRCRFSSGDIGFSFPRAHMDRPLASADPHLHRTMTMAAEALMTALPRDPTRLSEHVRTLLALGLTAPAPSVSRIARTLRMSKRTFARRLAAEQTTFSTLVNEARRERALHLLQKRLSLEEIAFELGYAHSTSFARSFRRWTGSKPTAYRQRAAEPE
jgi:AraC-like DNA-binding protein